MNIPKVFISYSHDSLEHKKWVLDLAIRLRASGIDAVVDQWDLRPGDDLSHFMETQLTTVDRVLMVCTEKYVQKANEGIGGVGYEKMIVTSALLERIDSNKVIPLIRQVGGGALPAFLRSKLYLDFSLPDQFEFSFDELVRTLHNAPLYEKPPVTRPQFPVEPEPAVTAKDGLKELMSKVIDRYESTTNIYQNYNKLLSEAKISRVMFELLFEQAIKQGYLEPADQDYYLLTTKGKLYAVNNGLVK